jgi:hypothetical protein
MDAMREIRKMKCLACGQRPVDACHVRSQGAGGPDEDWNLIPLTRECHQAQHALGWERFLNRYPKVREALIAKGWELEIVHGRFKMFNERQREPVGRPMPKEIL